MEKRAELKSRIMDQISEAKQLMCAEGNTERLKQVIESVNEEMDKFAQIHLDYIVSLGETGDSEAQKRYYDELSSEVLNMRVNADKYCVDKVEEHNKSITGRSKCSITSSKIKAASTKAKLIAEAQHLKRKQELERKAQELRQQEEELRLELAIAQADAEEKILEEMEDNEINFKKCSASDGSGSKRAGTVGEVQSRQSGNVISSTVSDNNVQRSGSVCSEPQYQVHDTVQQQRQFFDMLHAPRLEIPTFDGNPLQYHLFVRAFEQNVENVITSDSARLARLMQYTAGKANKVLQCCPLMEPHAGYQKAKTLLKERFGSEFIIANAWISKVTSEPPLKGNNYQGIQDYGDDLRNALETLEAMGYLGELNTQGNLVKIVSRLPIYLQNRWRKNVATIKQSKGRLPILKDVVSFVEIAAVELNDPIYGQVKQETVNVKQRRSTHRQPSSFGASTDQPNNDSNNSSKPKQQKCVMCDTMNHKIYICDQFKAMSPEDRTKIVKEKRLCYNCLNPNHKSRDCKSSRTCNTCNKRHNSLLHYDKDNTHQRAQYNNEQTSATSGYVDSVIKTTHMALPIVAVNIKSNESSKSVQTYALLDPGSTHSFCSAELLNKLNIRGKRDTIRLSTLEKAESVQETEVVSLTVSDVYNTTSTHMPNVFTRPQLPIHSDSIPTIADVNSWPHLRGIDLPAANINEVMLLIGQDSPEALIPRDVVIGGRAEPYATRSIFGWSLNGPLNRTGISNIAVSNLIMTEPESLSKQVEQFWKIDSHGLYDSQKSMSVNDQEVMSMWDKTIVRENNHYVMAIPFKDKKPNLPDPIKMAEKRLECLKRKLDNDENLKKQYTQSVQDMIDNKYIEKVPESEINRGDGKVWYLPHHPVVNPNKDKVRIVFDCAAVFNGQSLNSNVHQGPDLTNKLVGVLARFRLGEIAIMADVKSMFHQVRVPADDKDVLRFLWWPNGDTRETPDIYRMTVHLFGGTWSPSACAMALQRVIQDFGDKYSKDTVDTVKNSFYVDDCLRSVNGETKAVQIATEVKELLAEGGFNLTKFASNNHRVMSQIPDEVRASSMKDLDLAFNTTNVERALGAYWDMNSDTLGYRISSVHKPITKRGILSTLSSVYDPLGLASPFILSARKIVQDLFRSKIDWDDQIPAQQQKNWITWLSDLNNLPSVRIDRLIIQARQPTKHQLHHFADASTAAYGVVSYLLTQSEDGALSSYIVMAKSRLAPIKQVTIPRLELMAATLACRQDEMLTRELSPEITLCKSQFWSDSTIVLRYINNKNTRFHTFVANRLEIIRDQSHPKQWHHVKGEENPADDTSRGLSADRLKQTRWLNGPDFLTQTSDLEWPPFADTTLDTGDPEIKPVQTQVFTTDVNQLPLTRIINSYSSWDKLKTSVAWIIAIMNVLYNKTAPVNMITCSELKIAEKRIISYIQRITYQDELNQLSNGYQVSKSSSLIKLKPKLIDGLITVGGRLSNAQLSDSVKHPIIIPGDHHITELIIRDMHKVTGHSGREYLLSILQQKYWIVGARAAIRKVISKCIVCKRRDALSTQQQMADLPESRLTPGEPAFSHCGVDYFGHFYVKKGRGTEKRYGCLFTCLNTRAVHIEIAYHLDSDSFIKCLQRFMARRGKVKSLISDNGRNFIAAEKELKNELNKMDINKIQKSLNKQGIEWKFNPPYASHFGGVWERMIKSVRRVLYGLAIEQKMDDESLHTFMCLAESVINNRPLTHVSTDPNDLSAITPNHFLQLRAAESLEGSFTESCLRKRWRQIEYLTNVFWSRWLKEYLPTLQQRTKWMTSERDLRINDLVLVIDPSVARNDWLLGRIVETHEDKDGHVRKCRIKTKDSVLLRPISKICLLEAACTDR